MTEIYETCLIELSSSLRILWRVSNDERIRCDVELRKSVQVFINGIDATRGEDQLSFAKVTERHFSDLKNTDEIVSDKLINKEILSASRQVGRA